MSGLRAIQTALLAALLLGLAMLSAHALTFPALTGRVVDEAGILDAATTAAITDKLAAVEAKSGDQIVVVTLKSLQGTTIEDLGYQLGRAWKIGQADRNNGVVLIVAPNERKVRIEVGYGLEGALTDAVTQLIIRNVIAPRFKVGDFQGGITRGVDDIIQVVSGDAEEFQRRAAQRPDQTAPAIDVATLITIVIIFFVVISVLRNGGGGGSRRGFPGRYGGPVFIPSGGSWSSGSGGGGSSGGGFSGGGGSFGGGGASGDW